ncbi:MAG: tetratricopeptide repeat protein [Bacillaceae bacterium]
MHIIEQAVLEIENGNVDFGMAQLTNYLKMANEDEMFEIASIFQHFGYVDEAIGIIEQLRALYPYEGQLNLMLAELFIDQNEDDKAIEILSEISQEDSHYVQGLLLVADLYQAEGFDEVAEQKLLLAKNEMPNEPVIDFGLAEFYFSQGEYKKAAQYYTTLVSEADEFANTNLHLRLAECLSVANEYDEAIRHYELGLDKTLDLHSLFGYGFTCYQAGYYAKAIGIFEKIEGLEKDYPALYYYLGKSLEAEGRYNESLDALKKAVTFDENNVELYVEVAKVCARLKEFDLAEMYLRRALELDPEYSEALIRLVGLLLEQDNFDETIYLIEHAKELGEEEPQLMWDLAYAKYHVEEYEKALKLYRNAYNFFKEDISFLNQYAQFLVEEGFRAEGIEIYRQMLLLDPTLSEIEERLQGLGDE